jgi:hypothetical protein
MGLWKHGIMEDGFAGVQGLRYHWLYRIIDEFMRIERLEACVASPG